MKNNIWLIIIALLLFGNTKSKAQAEEEKLDLPGDNLNLYAVMKLFQESETLEGFERKLNDEETQINNLDLDGDNQIDYIRVFDNVDRKLHTISLKVALGQDEEQDVAVIFVEKKDDGQVLIQLVGDEDLYGKDYIIEPNSLSEDNGRETPNPGYSADRERPTVRNNTTYVISSWPVVQYIYVPDYVVWRSPWRWRYYPTYWRPWRPNYWHYYYGYHYHYHDYYNGHFRRWNAYRNPAWQTHYYGGGYRSRSVTVTRRSSRGDYRKTYSKPSSARQGSAVFVKRNPTAPSAKDRLPSFDRTGRPVVSRPGTSRPSTGRPGANPDVSRPVTRPGGGNGSSRPGGERPGTERPETGRPGTGRPVTTPIERPATTRPVTPNPSRERPATTRPDNPNPNPQRPATTRPINPNPDRERPVTRPVTPGPGRERPVPTQPSSRPAVERPTNRPSTPASSRPSERGRPTEPRSNR
ncbi:hypothetical protein MUK70_01915 [Dyadobacter chenwenxiniae]|uniref:DUF3300 domain-containing protein n=1 Tax=Dyadobacter chenwenxiniae TaxID=2906456 RepID=A0A9X1PJD9_9BACT|nr:hypothetical protein [Dyadobacter chenwenxiniae]MCF0062497.1 hypothetical protein [Dyadobacter chenwenxiniae]UON83757.1 hypothetical protein MUK70_01915 [Dyadobacter chenwenxiniae]